ncbi:MAG TPA: glycine cleavage system aminomethyltransferase GcvT [Roseiarcus sp.]|jgi:aminomethyltransferase|nr:glycine cleavage system aminomethyltransferase GcvT [Roseiarcus sp.]
MTEASNQKTPLYALHVELGARTAPFAGYDMPINYPAGVLAEHLHTRKSAGLFDVSHMGQALIEAADHAAVAGFLESLCPADFLNLVPGRERYTQLLNENGGIIDDLMVTRPPAADGALRLVVNAARKEVDFALIRERMPSSVRLTPLPESALIALQGPLAATTLASLAPGAGLETMRFMSARPVRLAGFETFVSRSGYTGEDGYEISLASVQAESFARLLLSQPDVAPIGLGARDSLRLEAGLCLYGHELDETVDPIEAALSWSIQKRRRVDGGFPGAKRVQDALANRPGRQRVGLRPDGRAPAREGAEIVSVDGAPLGVVTSGGFGPSVGAPIAMGYVARAHAEVGTPVSLMVRGKPLSARVVTLPFHPHAYYRG